MLALLYDIHGNLLALDAVLEDAERSGADRYLLGGDYTLFAARPGETLDRLERLPAAGWIRGNGERWTASPDEAPDIELVRSAIDACAAELGPERVRRLAALPEQALRGGTRYCHGSPVSDVRSFFPAPTDADAEMLDDAAEARIVFGHTHLAFRRVADVDGRQVELINPGSVGMPFDGDPRAAYALVSDGGEVELRRVPYDHRAAANEVRRRLGPLGGDGRAADRGGAVRRGLGSVATAARAPRASGGGLRSHLRYESRLRHPVPRAHGSTHPQSLLASRREVRCYGIY